MKSNREFLVVSTLTLAVQAALLTFSANAQAADDEVTASTNVTSTAEVGIANTSAASAKFGEYNGQNKSGNSVIANIRLRGGDAYNGGNGSTAWEVNGTDLGGTSRALSALVSDQGHWTLGFGYDELQHNISDTYQTPLIGKLGTASFTLPSNFGVVNTSYINPTTFKSGAQALTQAQLDAFHGADVHSDRRATSLMAGYTISPQWDVKFDINHLEQNGAKLMSVSTDAAAAASGPGGSTWGVEKMFIIMNPTSYTTDTYTLAVNWTGAQSRLSASYVGSFFRDDFTSVTFPNPFAALNASTPAMGTVATFPVNTMSTMPSNDFQQLNLNGAYSFSSSTKLVGGVSRARATQDSPYPFAMMQAKVGVTGATALPMGGGAPPQPSLNGLVVTTHADLRLSHQYNRDLAVSAGVKFNEHDNQTASNVYNFIDLGGKNRTSVNTPESYSKTQADVSGDYRINPANRLHVGVEYEAFIRWCNNDAANNARGVVPVGYVYTVNSCVQVPESKESKLVASYKLAASDALNFNVAYNYGKRDATVNASFYNPMQALAEGFETTGYRAFFQASREEQLIKAGATWQALEELSIGLNGRYVDDKYTDSPLGVQNGKSWNANLDATYNYSSRGTVSAYVSAQKRQRDLTNQAGHMPSLTVGGLWTNQLSDDTKTVGLNLTHKGLLGGKLDLSGDLSYSDAKTGYSTQVPYFVATAFAASCTSSASLICGSTPDITSKTTTLKLLGSYALDSKSKLNLGVMHQRLSSNDYYYNFYQTGYVGTGNLPTNEQPANYSINQVALTYFYTF